MLLKWYTNGFYNLEKRFSITETHTSAQVQVLSQFEITVKTQRRIVEAIHHAFNESSSLSVGDALSVSFGNLSKEYRVDSEGITNPDPYENRAPKADKLDYIRFVVITSEGHTVHKDQSVRAALARALSSRMPDVVGLSSLAYAEVDYLLYDSTRAGVSYSAGISTDDPDFESKLRAATIPLMATHP